MQRTRSVLWVTLLGLGLAVALIEWARPLAGRTDAGPDIDPNGAVVRMGSWALSREGKGRVLVDPDGHRVFLPGAPQRIVSQIILTDEVLVAMGQQRRVVGWSSLVADPRYSNVAAEAAGFETRVGSHAEAILALHPDLVFAATFSTPETVSQLQRAGVPVVRLSQFDSVDAVQENLRIIGFALQQESRAQVLIDGLRAEIRRAVARVPAGQRRPKVVSYSDGACPARGSIFDDVVRRLGGRNPASEAGLKGWPQVSAEQVARWDPDFFVVSAAPGEEAAKVAALTENPAIGATRAVLEGRIVVIPAAHFIAVSHHVGRFVTELGAGLYPEATP